jgi:hypothetical protein
MNKRPRRAKANVYRGLSVSAKHQQYTLYYAVFSPISKNEIGREEHFETIEDALSRSVNVLQQGGKPSHLIYEDAVLFSGQDLESLLARISARSASSADVKASISSVLQQALLDQLAKTVKFSHEHFGAVAVYRRFLEELYEAADRAIKERNLELLHLITGKLAFWYVPSESDVKQWGKDFLYAYRRDAGWLHDTKKALEKIKKVVKQLEVTEGSTNARLKAEILDAAEKGLITHV